MSTAHASNHIITATCYFEANTVCILYLFSTYSCSESIHWFPLIRIHLFLVHLFSCRFVINCSYSLLSNINIQIDFLSFSLTSLNCFVSDASYAFIFNTIVQFAYHFIHIGLNGVSLYELLEAWRCIMLSFYQCSE